MLRWVVLPSFHESSLRFFRGHLGRSTIHSLTVYSGSEGSHRVDRDDDGETQRFFALPDLWKGAELLRIASRAARALPDDVAGTMATTLERRLLRDLIPEIAYRLGVKNLPTDLCGDRTIRGIDAFDFRICVNSVITRIQGVPVAAAPAAWGLLTRDVTEGNVVAIALDRVAPPLVAADWISARLDAAWSHRGLPGRLTWSPDLVTAAAV